MAEELPYNVKSLSPEEQKEAIAKYPGISKGFVKVGEGNHLLPTHCIKHLDKYSNFRFRHDDVLIMTFPRSGTTWTQEIIWTMRNALNFHDAETIPLIFRSPFMEFDSLHAPELPFSSSVRERFLARHPDQDPAQSAIFLDIAEGAASPRTLKTHMPFCLFNDDLLDTCKVVYVARNPRDVCVSYYHHQRLVKTVEFRGEFPEFVDLWCRNLVLQAPYWSHLQAAWQRRHHPNLLFLFYEDMKEDLGRELQRLNTFLGTALTHQQLQQVANHSTFSGMKSRNTTNPTAAFVKAGAFVKGESDFVRKGTTGDWTNYFTPELDAKFQAWMTAGGAIAKDIPFRYHLEKQE